MALVTLTAMEIVLGIVYVVFIAILTTRLPAAQQPIARRVGLALALIIRIGLLFAITWVMSLTTPLFTLVRPFSGRDLILFGGGLFLIFKAVSEIHAKVEGGHPSAEARPGRASFAWVLAQILVLDIVFSLDSVITAVGMANQVSIMVVAMVIAMLVMLVSMDTVSGFVEHHPTVKILALAFLLLIGVMLVAEGMGHHIEKGYIYFAMTFSLAVELLNMRYRRRHQRLRSYPGDAG
ncbi:MAG: TerC family protein [Candidatus Rokuibacteriota bacterium]